ncbi:MAG: divergent polysaccharide deacetylase family protein [Deltaproteobacteria bacterium]|nr:divergent polysaccharide deacetylase family protein [Deltaproteobacteria bacterium]
MVTRKPGTRKKPKKKSRKDASLKTHLKRTIAGLSLLLILVVLAGFLAHHFIQQKHPISSRGKIPVAKKTVQKVPAFEVYPKKDIPPRKPILKPKIALPEKFPKVAIIIDDVGYDRQLVEKFLNLDAVLTFSILPFSPFTKKIAQAVHAGGAETMLHLPMEPNEYPRINPGPGTLLTSMSPDQLINQLEKDLDSVPFIKGVNNHMGSKMTTVSTQLYQIFSILKKRGLFFIDSRTTPHTLCKPSARLLQIPFAERDIFIDHIPDPDFIRKQLDRLILVACSHGEAVGIAHPHTTTYEVFREVLPDLQKRVRFVPASTIVHTGS